MADKKRNVSETFGKYTQSRAGEGSRVEGPKNITSDMWSPISGGQSVEDKNIAPQKSPQKKTAPTQKKPAQNKKPASVNKTDLISEGRKKEPDGKKGKLPENKKKKGTPKSRVPKGRPVSELGDERKSRQKAAEDIRRQQKLNKADRGYDNGRNDGKSHDELSKERAHVKRKKIERQNVIIIAVFVIFALAFAGIYVYSKGAPASAIIVEGDSIYSSEEVISASGLEIGVNMLSVREGEVSTRISSALPYIHSVQVKKKFPDELILTVTPAEDKFLFVNKGETVVADVHGKVLCVGEGKKLDYGLYRVYGVEWESCITGSALVPTATTAEKYNLAVSIVSALEKDGAIKKATVNVSDEKNVRVYCVDGESEIMIYLGSCRDTENRIALAGKVIASSEVSGKSGYIDLRFDNAYFREGTIYLS